LKTENMSKKKISTNPPIDSPEFKAGWAKASAELLAFRAGVNVLNKLRQPFREQQKKIFKVLEMKSAADKAIGKIFNEFEKQISGGNITAKLEYMKVFFSHMPTENNSAMEKFRKLEEYLQQRKSYLSAEENKIISLCLDLGADFARAANTKAIEQEMERWLAHKEYREEKDKSIRVKHEQYLTHVKEGISKRESARKVFKKWEKRRPEDKETDSLLRKLRRYAERNNLKY